MCDTKSFKMAYEMDLIKNQNLDEVGQILSRSPEHHDSSDKMSNGRDLNTPDLKEDEEGLADGDSWTGGHQTSLESQAQQCGAIPTRQESQGGHKISRNFSENLLKECNKKGLPPEKRKEECNTSLASGNVPSLADARKPEPVKVYQCGECYMAFNSKDACDKHMEVHSGVIKHHQCGACGKTFAKEKQLALHERSHSDIKPFKCEVCGKYFKNKHELHSHERTHLDIKPFKCGTCSKAFTRKTDLNRHERIHLGIKPYKCEVCSKVFIRKENFTRHEKTHLGLKPYKCEICLKTFTRKTDLNRHDRIHLNELERNLKDSLDD